MKFLDLLKELVSSKKRITQKKYVGTKIHLIIPSARGTITIEAESITAPNGFKGVKYDCFFVALEQWQQQILDENEFIEDMEKLVHLFLKGNTEKEIMLSLLEEHVARTGRLIDSDLCTYISELYIVLLAVNGKCDRNTLLNQMFQVAEQYYANKLFITQYRRTKLGIQPFLVSFTDFMKNMK